MNKYKAVCLASGGLDSAVIIKLVESNPLCEEIYVLSFDYGQKHDRELTTLKSYLRDLKKIKQHKVIKLDFGLFEHNSLTSQTLQVPSIQEVIGDPQPSTYVPFRNQLFLTLACSWAEDLYSQQDTLDSTTWRVFYGATQVDNIAGYWDCTKEFLRNFNTLISFNRRCIIECEAPLIDYSKEEIIKLGQKLNVDFTKTWTCYEGKQYPCQKCAACSSRIQGFEDAGIKDPLLA